MKRYFALLFLFVLLFAGNNAFAQQPAGNQTAIDFNDRLVSITDSLYQLGGNWGTAFNAAYKSMDFTTLKPVRQNLEAFVDRNIAWVNKLKDVSGSEELRKAMAAFLLFEKEMIKSFKAFEAFSSSSTEAEIKAAIDHLTEESGRESGELKKLTEAQEAYGAKNGFTIEVTEEE